MHHMLKPVGGPETVSENGLNRESAREDARVARLYPAPEGTTGGGEGKRPIIGPTYSKGFYPDEPELVDNPEAPGNDTVEHLVSHHQKKNRWFSQGSFRNPRQDLTPFNEKDDQNKGDPKRLPSVLRTGKAEDRIRKK